MTALASAALATTCVAGLLLGLRMARSTPVAARELAGGGAAEERLTPGQRWSAWVGRRFGPRVLGLMSDRRVRQISHRLDAAGHPGGLDVRGYAARKAVLTVAGLLGAVPLVLLTGTPLPLPALALAGWLIVDFSLAAQAKRRQAQIDRDLPDFLDVLTITVGAGLGFRNALRRVSDELGGPLAEEVRTVLRQISLGARRRDAFEALRARNDSEPLGVFVTAFLQAEELGTPLGDTMATIAQDMRKEFGQRARRKAAQATPKVSLVITTVIVPGGVILVLAALFSRADFGFLSGG